MLNPIPSKDEFISLSKDYNIVPIYIEIPCDLETPISLFYKIAEGRYNFLLESVEGAEKWARYSFIGIKPFLVFKSKNEKISIFEKSSNLGGKMHTQI